MSFFDRIVEGAERRSSSGLTNPSGWLLEAFGTSAAYSGERVTQKNAMGLAAVFSAVEIISEAVGSLPLKVYRIVEDDDRVEARSHRAWRLLHDKPNEHSTAHSFWSTATAQILLGGNAFVLKERSGESLEVESLYLLDPASITIESDGRSKQFVVNASGNRTVYHAEDVLHIMGFSLDGLIGCSRIAYCRETLGTALGRARFEGEFYAQGAKFPGVIEYPGRLGEQGVKNLASAMAAKHGGPGNRHKVPVLEEGATFKQTGMSLADMQFVESAQLSRADIATMFNLPASYLNASSGDSLTYATTESNQIQFAQMAIAPITNRIAKAITNDPEILPWNVMYAEFVLEGLLRADMKTRAEYWASMKTTLNLAPEFIATRENIPKSALEASPEPAPEPALPTPEEELAAMAALPAEMRSRAEEREERDEHFAEMRSLIEAIRPQDVSITVPPTVIEEGAVRVNIDNHPPAPAPIRFEKGSFEVTAPAVTIAEGAVQVEVEAPPPAQVEAHFHAAKPGRVRRTVDRDPDTGEITGSTETEIEETK